MKKLVIAILLIKPMSVWSTDASTQGVDAPRVSNNAYVAPTPEELVPLRPEYLAELAKIHEPGEMTLRPMKARQPVPSLVVRFGELLRAYPTPDKATHQQRESESNALVTLASQAGTGDLATKSKVYEFLANLSCIDGAAPARSLDFVDMAAEGSEDSSDLIAFRGKLELRLGKRRQALDDLETLMRRGDAHALTSGESDPRKGPSPCTWSIDDFEILSADPRGLAGKAFYLSAYIPFGAEDRKTANEAEIRDLYARSALQWRSPIPHILTAQVDGFGSREMLDDMTCVRFALHEAGKTSNACEQKDQRARARIRELTMAVVIDPRSSKAYLRRAGEYLDLAEGQYADAKPSLHLYEQAIADFNAAVDGATADDLHTLYCDRAIAQASIGRYEEAANGYIECMKHAQNGVEDSPFVYEQLAHVYSRLNEPKLAADTLTRAISFSKGGGLDSAILLAGMTTMRALYPEYDTLPDEIFADMIRRRFYPQFEKSWDSAFIKEKRVLTSSILAELYVLRGDAFLKAKMKASADADYLRVKSDAWEGGSPRELYFDSSGRRVADVPERWPAPPPKD